MLAIAADLVGQCEKENRCLVAWSTREFLAFTEAIDIDDPLLERVGALYRDAKRTARDWKRQEFPEVVFKASPHVGRHRLANYLGLVDYRVPPHLGDQKAGKRLRDVRGQLARHRDFQGLTHTAKTKWTNLLHYNFHDCNGMRVVASRAAAELASPAGRSVRHL